WPWRRARLEKAEDGCRGRPFGPYGGGCQHGEVAFYKGAAPWESRAKTPPRPGLGEIVGKTGWGAKRICPRCRGADYRRLRKPVVCPKCATPFDPEAFLKSRRARPAAPVEKEVGPVGGDELEAEVDTEEADAAEEEEEEAAPLEEAEEEDEELLEDASE